MNELTEKLKDEFKDKEYAHAYTNEFLNTRIATQIKVLREQRGLTQQQLADLTGMQQARISVLENVNNEGWSISTLQRLAEAFDVSLNVSFEAFSSRIEDIQNMDRDSLEVPSRDMDLAQMNQAVTAWAGFHWMDNEDNNLYPATNFVTRVNTVAPNYLLGDTAYSIALGKLPSIKKEDIGQAQSTQESELLVKRKAA